tara:strand:- start:163 stop:1110 length:948 start_codon:yes stop_codon:yes gene_type:complete
MIDAPLYKIDGINCPDGSAYYFPLDNGNKLRVAFWNLEGKKGTIILQSGRTEFIEKYYEVISEFIDRGFCVAMMDWRGQGLSSRKTNNERIGHIDKFETYDQDLVRVVNECFKSKCPDPFIGFGHSMGGCLMTSYFISPENELSRCILSAPMVSVRANAVSRRAVSLLGIFENLGLGAFPMQRPSWDEDSGWQEEPFLENALTTDKVRFNRTFKFLSQFPDLGVRGVTVGWLKHALKRTNDFKLLDWSLVIKKPLLLLDATNDKLVNSSINRKLLGQSVLTTIISMESQHEIMMEKDEIRKKAWDAIDQFLSPVT